MVYHPLRSFFDHLSQVERDLHLEAPDEFVRPRRKRRRHHDRSKGKDKERPRVRENERASRGVEESPEGVPDTSAMGSLAALHSGVKELLDYHADAETSPELYARAQEPPSAIETDVVLPAGNDGAVGNVWPGGGRTATSALEAQEKPQGNFNVGPPPYAQTTPQRPSRSHIAPNSVESGHITTPDVSFERTGVDPRGPVQAETKKQRKGAAASLLARKKEQARKRSLLFQSAVAGPSTITLNRAGRGDMRSSDNPKRGIGRRPPQSAGTALATMKDATASRRARGTALAMAAGGLEVACGSGGKKISMLEYSEHLRARIPPGGMFHGMAIFTAAKRFDASVRRDVERLFKHGATPTGSYDPNTVTHIVTSLSERECKSVLGVESWDEVPAEIIVVRRDWIVACLQHNQLILQANGAPVPPPSYLLRPHPLSAVAENATEGPSNASRHYDDTRQHGALSPGDSSKGKEIQLRDGSPSPVLEDISADPPALHWLDRSPSDAGHKGVDLQLAKGRGPLSVTEHRVVPPSNEAQVDLYSVLHLAKDLTNEDLDALERGEDFALESSTDHEFLTSTSPTKEKRRSTDEIIVLNPHANQVDSSDEPSDEEFTRNEKRKEEVREAKTAKRKKDKDNGGSFRCLDPAVPSARINNPNEGVCKFFEALIEYHEAQAGDGDRWRVMSYRRVVNILRNQPRKINSYEEAVALRGIGEKTAQKIDEIVKTNSLRRLGFQNAEDEAVKKFVGIYGVGSKQARKWYKQGMRSLEDISRRTDLSEAMQLGLRFYDDLQQRIPRKEAFQIYNTIDKAAVALDPRAQVMIMGSYRRGAPTCGDIDILLTRPTDGGRTHAGLLKRLHNVLHAKGIITYDLAVPHNWDDVEAKWMGLCQLDPRLPQRRLDILCTPFNQVGAALIYFTGNEIYNRSLRLLAQKKGYRLNQRGLYEGAIWDRKTGHKLTEGRIIASASEEEILGRLGVKWFPPEQRNVG